MDLRRRDGVLFNTRKLSNKRKEDFIYNTLFKGVN